MAGLPLVEMAVNVSPRQLRQNGFIDTVMRIPDETGLPPRYLTLEITESLLIEDISLPRKVLRLLRDRGIQVSLDDFCTGYSSLGYLDNLSTDALKIDGSFARGVALDTPAAEATRAVASGIITLAHRLGLKVVAECVETHEQLARLRNKGCDSIQGYLFSPAVSDNELAECCGILSTLWIGVALPEPQSHRCSFYEKSDRPLLVILRHSLGAEFGQLQPFAKGRSTRQRVSVKL